MTLRTKLKMLRYAIFILSINPNIYWVAATGNLINMMQQQFSGEDATSSVFGRDTKNIFPVAYFDVNADKLTDLITVSRDRTSVSVFLASQEPPFLRRALKSPVLTSDSDHHNDKRIVSIRPGDFTGDGQIDIMVTLAPDTVNYTEFLDGIDTSVDVVFCQFKFYKELSDHINFVCPGPGNARFEKLVQEPMALDINGDMVLDLLGERWVKVKVNGSTTYKKERMVWFSENAQDSFVWRNEAFNLIGSSISETHDMVNVSSNAFADIDGDLAPELLILTEDADVPRSKSAYFLETYEIVKDSDQRTSFRFKKPPEFVETYPINQTKVIGQPGIIDLEHNGKLSHLLPYCLDFRCSNFGIYVVEQGKAVPLPLASFVYDGVPWSFVPPQKPPTPPSTSASSATTTTTTHPPPPNPEDFLMEAFYSRTVAFRVGDYNLDGYPDLLFVMKANTQTHQEKVTRAVMFENVPCAPTPDKPCYYSRTFAPNFDIFQDYKNVISASFYDINENGVLDVILVMLEQNEPTRARDQKFVIRAVKNEMNFDSSFLKVMVLTGQQCLECKSGIPYGNVLPGATVSYTSVNSVGKLETGVVAQTYRTSHMPLDLPCEIFGIGHSPNFVETLTVAVSPNADERYKRDWLQIIPNSQVVIIPNPIPRPHRWTMKLFLTPSDVVLKTFGVLVGIGLVIGTIVAGLEYKERREDRLARQSEAHRLLMY